MDIITRAERALICDQCGNPFWENEADTTSDFRGDIIEQRCPYCGEVLNNEA